MLAEDRLRLSLLLEIVPTRVVEEAELRDVDPDLRTLQNLNTPEDYEAALESVSAAGFTPRTPPRPATE